MSYSQAELRKITGHDEKWVRAHLKLMSPEEMRCRLEEGEDALDLAIDKWERIVVFHQEVGSPPSFIFADGGTCALCQEMELKPCLDCRYYKFYREPCSVAGAPRHDYWRFKDTETAEAMLNALVALKEVDAT